MCRMWWPLTMTYIFKVIRPWLWKSCPLCNVFSSSFKNVMGCLLWVLWRKLALLKRHCIVIYYVHLFQHLSSIQQQLIPEIEGRLRKKCENLVHFHDSSGADQGKITCIKYFLNWCLALYPSYTHLNTRNAAKFCKLSLTILNVIIGWTKLIWNHWKPARLGRKYVLLISQHYACWWPSTARF